MLCYVMLCVKIRVENLSDLLICLNKSVSRRQYKRGLHDEICLLEGRKHCGKRRKCWLPAFFSFFPQCFQEDFIRICKNSETCGTCK